MQLTLDGRRYVDARVRARDVWIVAIRNVRGAGIQVR